MGYPESEWERAMRVQEVMMRAPSGELHWFQAADILGVDVRTMRRWREKFERIERSIEGVNGNSPPSRQSSSRCTRRRQRRSRTRQHASALCPRAGAPRQST